MAKDTYGSTYGAGKDFWDGQQQTDAAKRLKANAQAKDKKGGK